MKRKNIQKTITELFDGSYYFVVPLYQRNFAWGEIEITQLLQDLYENYKSGTPYFVGSIVFIDRKTDGRIEVIDGQQRLTVLTLLLNVLGKDLISHLYSPRLEYDSRDEVMEYLSHLYDNKEIYSKSQPKEVVKTFMAAYETLGKGALDSKDEKLTINSLKAKDEKELKGFVDYLLNKVYFVLAEMPQDTDVATYFEIMNNTGEQLRKHEVLKGLLLRSAEARGVTYEEMKSLAMVWDACSQMDIRIQEAITNNKRTLLFGEDYQGFHPENITKLCDENSGNESEEGSSIDEIINNEKYNKPVKEEKDNDKPLEIKGSSIIDFPNFLMHVLRISYNADYRKIKGYKEKEIEEEREKEDIPLNEKDLLDVYKALESKIDAKEFIGKVLYYRIIFDRYIVRRTDDSENDGKWVLAYAVKHKDNNSFYLRNTFGKGTCDDVDDANNKAVKALSMLQVSYPQRKYKNFLFNILSWFKGEEVSHDYNWFMPRLHSLVYDTFTRIEEEKGDELLHSGTSTPRFILNFIDYLYFLQDNSHNFDFQYFNSVEHHLPQSRENYEKVSREILDNIGNLFLLSRRDNSSLHDNDPVTKAKKSNDKIKNYPPNRKLIYEKTIEQGKWEKNDIERHGEEIQMLFKKGKEILEVKDLESSTLLWRACMAVTDYCKNICGWSYGMPRYDFFNQTGKTATEAKEEVSGWMNKNMGKTLEDFIDYELRNNENLKNESWRYIFVKYPSVMNYCRQGNFSFNRDGYEIYLMTGTSMHNEAQELHCHLLNELGVDFSISSVSLNLVTISLHNTLFKQKYTEAQVSLRLWVDHDNRKWCYELISNRSGNASENKVLKTNGWIKNETGNYYIKGRPYLCDCPEDYEEAAELALKHSREIIGILNSL